MEFCSNIIFVSPVRYKGLRQRHQAFADLLAKHENHVLFIEPIQPNGFSVNFKKANANLTICSVIMPFRATRYPTINRMILQIVLKLLEKKCQLRFSETVFWTADPSFAPWLAVKWKNIIYDRCDLHGFFPGQNLNVWQYYESFFFKNASLIIASSKALFKNIEKPWQDKCILIGNAAPASWLIYPSLAKQQPPPIKFISSGAHYEWIDFSWLEAITNNSKTELHIVGTGRGNHFQRLINKPNVKFHGLVNHEQLVKLISECHIGVIPFIDSPLTRCVDPIKAYEYAALKLRVWTSPIPSLAGHPMVDDAFPISELNTKIEEFLSNPSCLKQKQIPTWEERFKIISHFHF